MDIKDLLLILSPLMSVVSIFIATRRGMRQDDSSSGREMGVLLTEVGAIKSSLAELGKKFDGLENRYAELRERVAIVEQSAKSAHRRLDETGGFTNDKA
jgi:hypothetical protein